MQRNHSLIFCENVIKKNNLFFFIIVATHRSFISAYSVWRRRQQQLQLPDPFKRPNWTNAAWRILFVFIMIVFFLLLFISIPRCLLYHIYSLSFGRLFVVVLSACMCTHTYTRSCWRSYNLHFIVHASVVKLVIFCSKNSGNAIGNPHVRRC